MNNLPNNLMFKSKTQNKQVPEYITKPGNNPMLPGTYVPMLWYICTTTLRCVFKNPDRSRAKFV